MQNGESHNRTTQSKGTSLEDEEWILALHPWVREAIRNDERDRPLTLNWMPAEPDSLDHLGLPRLPSRLSAVRIQIIAEALVAGERWTSYSRRRQNYAKAQRYYRSTYTYDAIVPTVDQLAAEGLLDHQKMPQGHRGFQSRFRASDLLLTALDKAPVVYRPIESIILRDLNGDPLDYRDNRETRRMRRRLAAINEALVSQQIGISGRIIREGDRLNGGRARIQMHRVFNRSSFGNGGRFYGGFWQNIPSADRKLITINGEDTVEQDYEALHIRLLYQEAGKTFVGDPYDIEGWPRKQVKLAMLIAINAMTEIAAVRAIAMFLGGPTKMARARALLAVVRAKHSGIAHAFGSDAGTRLMRQDSDMAEAIMLSMIQHGTAPLCVHDSFIVPAYEVHKLVEVMEARMLERPYQNHPNSETSYLYEKPKESPKTIPQYGVEGGVVVEDVVVEDGKVVEVVVEDVVVEDGKVVEVVVMGAEEWRSGYLVLPGGGLDAWRM